MATWNSRGLRGSGFEELINDSLMAYEEAGLSLIQKIPTPITPIEMDKGKGHITLAYFDKKSTVDYIGVVQGIPVCFDAKECNEERFPLSNIHEHQMEFMEKFEAQGGLAFFLISFNNIEKYYYLRFKEAKGFFSRMEAGGRKSFTISELDPDWFFEPQDVYVPFLPLIDRDLEIRTGDVNI